MAENAVIYCRVSTDEEVQLNALSGQISEAHQAVKNNRWILVDEYIDEGRSGTTTKKRNEYSRLVQDLESDKFDIIVIKSQDRLMRNVKDWYIFVDKLVKNNKKLYFYLENKFYTPDDALITGIKAILAEEFSRDLSKKINNAHRNRQKKGTSILITSKTWGYDKVDKQVVINEQEAERVRRIYELCLEGYGSRSICKILANEGQVNRNGKNMAEGVIRRILRNPLYKGTAVMNKRHMDFNTKKTLHMPEEEWIIHENAVPPIVSEEVWNKANKIMDKRSEIELTADFVKKRKGKFRGNYVLSSKIICGECGSKYWRRYRRQYKNKENIIVEWSCSEYIQRGRKTKPVVQPLNVVVETKNGGCDNIHIKEENLNKLLYEISNEIFGDRKEKIIDDALAILESVISERNLEEEIQKIENEKNKICRHKDLLLDRLLDETISNEDYKIKDLSLTKKLQEIMRKEGDLVIETSNYKAKSDRLKKMKEELLQEDFVATLESITEHIETIIVYKDKLDINFDLFGTTSYPIEKIKS